MDRDGAGGEDARRKVSNLPPRARVLDQSLLRLEYQKAATPMRAMTTHRTILTLLSGMWIAGWKWG